MRAGWAAAIVAFALFGTAASAAEEPSIAWTVINRNRLLVNEAEEKRYLFTLNNYMARAAKSTACDPRRFGPPSPKNEADLASCVRSRRSRYPAPTNVQFRTRWSPLNHAYKPGYIRKDRADELREVSLGITVRSGREWTRDRGVTCNWRIDGEQVGANVSCRTFLRTVSLGAHQVAVDAMRGGQPLQRIPETGAQEIAVEDYVIAVLGDSFGSGEGNPHAFFAPSSLHGRDTGYVNNKPAMWLDPRCHRSLFSSSGIMTALLADRYKHASFSLATFACSGAETSEGMLDPYYGRETAGQFHKEWRDTSGNIQSASVDELFKGFSPDHLPPVGDQNSPAPRDIPSQLDQLRTLLCPQGGGACRKPDAIIIYIGVNDIGFSDIVKQLVLGCRPERCEAQVGAAIKTGLARIEANLAKIKTTLDQRGLLPAEPDRVVVVTYPNPLTYRAATGRNLFCDWRKAGIEGGENFLGFPGTLLALGIREASATWAHDNVLIPLNQLLRRSAAGFGWSVANAENIALGHGFCAKGRWFQIYPESENKQGIIPKDFARTAGATVRPTGAVPSGAMHPNIFGHRNVAATIGETLRKLLDLESTR